MVGQLKTLSKQYDIGNLFINSHGMQSKPGGWLGSDELWGSFVYDNRALFKELGSLMSSNSRICMISCFSANPDYGGDNFIGEIAQYSGRDALGIQGFAFGNFNSYEGTLFQNGHLSRTSAYICSVLVK